MALIVRAQHRSSQVSERLMRAFFVVALQPGIGDFPDLVQVLERVGVEPLNTIGLEVLLKRSM
jgi:hypothetical protein